MTIELVDGKAGTAHISSEDKAIIHQAKFSKSDVVFDWGDAFKCSMSSSNRATIGTGCASIQGLDWHITSAESVTISNGSQGMKRNDIICAHYNRNPKNGNENVELAVLKGSPNATAAADPTIPSGKILSGAVDAYMPLWRIPLDGITVGTPVRLFTPRGALWDSVTQSGEWVVVARPRGYDAYCVASMIFKPNTNTSIDIKLPIEAANWDSYSVELQLMNDAKNKVPSFNNISMITNSHSAKGFQLVAWNASGTSLSYRIAVTVHVFDAKQ
ncbi:hypothetical protein [Bifidobacterium catenulatum]|uniref:hypothetical protein n=1 Tax=Bifidobacterium catenulatum TaxID=1686 RepID=UPI00247FB91A|nr:hypothetical protein [Bifidobacterium catenulatum]MDH7887858.1 hypothetical protein [Bifidobacterium catenulatum subsp. kashiwanohense]